VSPEAFWAAIDLPQVPTLEEVRCYARERLAQTASLDEIALTTRQRLLSIAHLQLIEMATSSPGVGS
jgi:hypothetical protein